jgi:hypothetical protein
MANLKELDAMVDGMNLKKLLGQCLWQMHPR